MTNFHSNYKKSSSDSIGLSFIKTYNLWHKRIKEQLATLNLTHPQYVVLASLGYLSQYHEEVNQVAISKQSDIDVMTVSTIIKNLEKAKLITRQESKKDTRAKIVQLTKNGEIILNKALPIVEEIDAKFFGVLDSNREQLNAFLIELIEANME
jgi:DNA-binding MarR family transcriptional regulator